MRDEERAKQRGKEIKEKWIREEGKCKWVRIKRQDKCFHVEQLPVIQVKHHNTVCGRRLCCEWQTSCKWMIMACLAVGHLRRLGSLLFPVNIAGFSLADLSDVLLFLLIFNGITPHADWHGRPTWSLSWRRKPKITSFSEMHRGYMDSMSCSPRLSLSLSLPSVACASSLDEFLFFNYSQEGEDVASCLIAAILPTLMVLLCRATAEL